MQGLDWVINSKGRTRFVFTAFFDSGFNNSLVRLYLIPQVQGGHLSHAELFPGFRETDQLESSSDSCSFSSDFNSELSV